MTLEEAKDYVLTHQPCTVLGVIALFDLYFKGWLSLDKLTGLRPGVFGYRTLVFCLKFPAEVEAESHPMPKAKELHSHLLFWFSRHEFKVKKVDKEFAVAGIPSTRTYWVDSACEIKEDRQPQAPRKEGHFHYGRL